MPFMIAAVAGVISIQYTLGPELEKQAQEREERSRREAGVPTNVVETSTAKTELEKSKLTADDQKSTGEIKSHKTT